MNREVPFSSKRMLLTLTLCACAVILLQNHELSQRLSFPLTLGAMAAGLAVCFLFFVPSVLLKSRYNTDALCLLRDRSKPIRALTAALCGASFLYVAVYFLLPYTEMFCKKYYPDASPCLIAFLLLGCCVYAAVKGVNVITRFGIFLFVLAMTTNLLLFGGCVSSLDFQNGGAFFSGEPEDFLQDMLYFATPCFIAALFACLCGSAKQFRTRHVTIALLMTGVKFALVLFFILYSVGAYAARQEYRTFVLSRVAHFGSFSGIESFYMALSTMSVFMILSLLLCGITKSAGKPGSLPLTAALTGGIFVLHWLAELFPFVRECFTRPLLLIGFSFLTAVVLPSVLLIQKRRQHA